MTQFAKTWEEETKEDTMENLYLTFSLDNKDYAFEVRHLVEILALPPITTIPGTISFLKGVINLRGKVIPVLDMRLRFLMEPIAYHDRTCVLLVQWEDLVIGLIVDKVNEVTRILKDHIDPAPKIGDSLASRFITATGRIGDEVKIIIDITKILSDDETTLAKQIPQS
ncbi:chemotaxis protein CheW [Leptospira idonii]|uniref:Purine-binding chemotaxis protein CheW n=1 Tax=Leptospira idonii TaxID=1193500 RepID=A0A4R9M307_9LEPT|nr:chemotaxis protein CheW [Leptospira idonii]TGN19188.1 purine-binding chemotaxis protein CheW [Leptospira idonii]